MTLGRKCLGGSIASNGHQYWRMNELVNGGVGSSTKAEVVEMEFRVTEGGADQANGGTAIASTEQEFGEASWAFDSSTGTSWKSTSGAELPQWLGYNFAEALEVVEVTMRAGNTTTNIKRMPTTFKIEYSDDGVVWTEAAYYSGITWSAGQTQAFAV